MDNTCHLRSCAQPGTLYLEAIDDYVCEDHLYVYLEAGNFSHVIGDGKPTDADKIVKLLSIVRSVFEKILKYAEAWYPKEMKEKELMKLKELEAEFFAEERRFENATQDDDRKLLKRAERNLNSFIFKLQTSEPYVRYLTHMESVRVFSGVDQEDKIQKLMEGQTEEEKQAIEKIKETYDEKVERLERKQIEEIKGLKEEHFQTLRIEKEKTVALKRDKDILERKYQGIIDNKDLMIANLAKLAKEEKPISVPLQCTSTPVGDDERYTPAEIAEMIGVDKVDYDNDDRNFVLDLTNPDDIKFIEGAKNFKFEGLNRLYIDNVPPKSQPLADLLSNSFTFINGILFNRGHSKIKGDFYLETLRKIGKKTKLTVKFFNLELDHDGIGKLLKYGKHVQDFFEFRGCKLNLDPDADFSEYLTGASFSYLDLSDCGTPMNSDWGDEPENFINFIKCISRFKNINKKLQSIDTCGSCLEEDFVRKVYDDFGLTNVKIRSHS